MRRIIMFMAAIIMLTLAACGSSSSGSSSEMDEFVGKQKDCASKVESGEAITADDIATCKSAFGAVGNTCDGKPTQMVNINDTKWLLVEGEPAVEQPNEVETFNDICP